MQRERISSQTLRTEEDRIQAFALAVFEPSPGAKLPVEDAFNYYQAWLHDRDMPATPLSVGGFGKLFPKVFGRQSMWTRSGTRRGFLDVKLRMQ